MGQASKGEILFFSVTALALLAGLILSLVSWMRLCSGACAEGHNWRFFGWTFERVGLLFFIPANLLFWSSKWSYQWSKTCQAIVGLLVAGAAGAEMHFILIQKYKIGAWCPVCLSIAACVGIAAVCFAIQTLRKIRYKEMLKGENMTTVWKAICGVSVCVLGFCMSLIGVAKLDPLSAAETTIKESLVFGKSDSPIEIYVFTDWACPACRALEPTIESAMPTILENARLTFVDHAIHTETLNYSPYNVSFMIRNKPEYMKLRDGLTELSLTTGNPTDAQVEKIADEAHVHYERLNYSDVALSQKYFKQLGTQFGIKQTPTLVIINRETKKGKKMIGLDQITPEGVTKAIRSFKR